MLGDIEGLGDGEILGLCETLGEKDGDSEGLIDGLSETDGLRLGEILGLSENIILGDIEGLRDCEIEGL
jgi:hypothetical protein